MPVRFLNKVFPFRGLPLPVYVLFVSRIIDRMGDFVRYFLTLYLTRILGFPPQTVGLIVTGAAVAGMAGGLISGRLADRLGRKNVMLGSQLLSAAVLSVCGFSPDASWLPLALISSQFFFGAARPASQALVTDITPVEDRRKAFSLLYFGINIGVSLGPIVAGFLFENHRRWIFWGDALTTLTGVLLVAFLVHEPPAAEVHRGGFREDADDSGAVRAFWKRQILFWFVMVNVVINFVYAQTHFALPLLMDGLFEKSSARNFGYLMSVNAVSVLVFTPVLLHFFGHSRPGRNMVWGALCYAVGFGALAFVPAMMSWILLTTVIWTLGEIIFATNSGMFTAAYTPMNQRGRFASFEHLASGFGSVMAPLAAGYLTVHLGSRGVWIPILLLSFLIMGALAILDRRDRAAGTHR